MAKDNKKTLKEIPLHIPIHINLLIDAFHKSIDKII